MSESFIAKKINGAGLNFSIVGGTNQPNGKENLVWVNTEIPIMSWAISRYRPIGVVEQKHIMPGYWKFEKYSKITQSESILSTLSGMTPVNATYYPYQDISTTLNIGDNYTAKCSINIFSRVDKIINISFITNDAGSIYLNDNYITDLVAATKKEVPLPIKSGWNELIVCYTEDTGNDGWFVDSSLYNDSDFLIVGIENSSSEISKIYPEIIKSPLQNGMVWIQKGTDNNGINIIKKNAIEIYLSKCQQYIDGVWTNADAFLYKNGAWTRFSQTTAPILLTIQHPANNASYINITIVDKESGNTITTGSLTGSDSYSAMTDKDYTFTYFGVSHILRCTVRSTPAPFFSGTMITNGLTISSFSGGSGVNNASYIWSFSQDGLM